MGFGSLDEAPPVRKPSFSGSGCRVPSHSPRLGRASGMEVRGFLTVVIGHHLVLSNLAP